MNNLAQKLEDEELCFPKALAEDFVKMQQEVKKAVKNKNNNHFNFDYADLESCWEACKEALGKYGFGCTYTTYMNEKGIFLRTILVHKSGHAIYGDLPLLFQQNSMQALGAALTFGKRYGLVAVVGIRDDDGENVTTTLESNGYPQEFTGDREPGSDDNSVYRIDFGKHENKTLSELKRSDLESYYHYLKGQPEKTGKPLDLKAKRFLSEVEKFFQRE